MRSTSVFVALLLGSIQSLLVIISPLQLCTHTTEKELQIFLQQTQHLPLMNAPNLWRLLGYELADLRAHFHASSNYASFIDTLLELIKPNEGPSSKDALAPSQAKTIINRFLSPQLHRTPAGRAFIRESLRKQHTHRLDHIRFSSDMFMSRHYARADRSLLLEYIHKHPSTINDTRSPRSLLLDVMSSGQHLELLDSRILQELATCDLSMCKKKKLRLIKEMTRAANAGHLNTNLVYYRLKALTKNKKPEMTRFVLAAQDAIDALKFPVSLKKSINVLLLEVKRIKSQLSNRELRRARTKKESPLVASRLSALNQLLKHLPLCISSSLRGNLSLEILTKALEMEALPTAAILERTQQVLVDFPPSKVSPYVARIFLSWRPQRPEPTWSQLLPPQWQAQLMIATNDRYYFPLETLSSSSQRRIWRAHRLVIADHWQRLFLSSVWDRIDARKPRAGLYGGGGNDADNVASSDSSSADDSYGLGPTFRDLSKITLNRLDRDGRPWLLRILERTDQLEGQIIGTLHDNSVRFNCQQPTALIGRYWWDRLLALVVLDRPMPSLSKSVIAYIINSTQAELPDVKDLCLAMEADGGRDRDWTQNYPHIPSPDADIADEQGRQTQLVAQAIRDVYVASKLPTSLISYALSLSQ